MICRITVQSALSHQQVPMSSWTDLSLPSTICTSQKLFSGKIQTYRHQKTSLCADAVKSNKPMMMSKQGFIKSV